MAHKPSQRLLGDRCSSAAPSRLASRLAGLLMTLAMGCSPSAPAEPPTVSTATAAPAVDEAQPAAPTKKAIERRPFAPTVAGKPAKKGISYGPFREGQKPGGPDPTAEQILEDLKIVAQRWQLIRVYSSRGPTETILKTIRDHQLPLGVMVGAWIAPDDASANDAEVEGLIKTAWGRK